MTTEAKLLRRIAEAERDAAECHDPRFARLRQRDADYLRGILRAGAEAGPQGQGPIEECSV